MPLPKPKPNESQKDFIQRCVVDPNIQKEGKTPEQRLGICYSIYESKDSIS